MEMKSIKMQKGCDRNQAGSGERSWHAGTHICPGFGVGTGIGMEHGGPIPRTHERGRDRHRKCPCEIGFGLLRQDKELNASNK